MAGQDREKALESALLHLEKQFGKGTVMRLGDQPIVPMDVIPTGSIALDVALGIGGLPRGRIVEIYGPESIGQDDTGPACGGQRAEGRGHRGLHRRRARAGPRLRPASRREPRRAVSPSPTRGSRHWRSPTPWCARAPSI